MEELRTCAIQWSGSEDTGTGIARREEECSS